MYKLNLVVGDSSGDGHSQTDTFIIESTLNKEEFLDAYKKGSEILGVDIIEKELNDYELNQISNSTFGILCTYAHKIKHPYHIPQFPSSEEWMHLICFVVRLGNSLFEYIVDNGDATIDIGGYGLYI